MKLLEEIRNDIEGLKLLKDWLGDGTDPVSQVRAEHRANACAFGDNGMPCSMNREPNWWERFKSSIAETIRSELELKHHLELKVSSEDALHMCAACGCCIKLKVWTPTEHIKAHLNEAQIAKTTSFCWMKKELRQ